MDEAAAVTRDFIQHHFRTKKFNEVPLYYPSPDLTIELHCSMNTYVCTPRLQSSQEQVTIAKTISARFDQRCWSYLLHLESNPEVSTKTGHS